MIDYSKYIPTSQLPIKRDNDYKVGQIYQMATFKPDPSVTYENVCVYEVTAVEGKKISIKILAGKTSIGGFVRTCNCDIYSRLLTDRPQKKSRLQMIFEDEGL